MAGASGARRPCPSAGARRRLAGEYGGAAAAAVGGSWRQQEGPTGTLVVGVDGSQTSLEAMRFAFREARLRGASLRAVCAWHVPPAAFGDGLAPTPAEVGDYPRAAERTLADALAATTEERDGVAVESRVVEGLPAEVLVEESEGAELLVVGSRGLGELRSLVLGSVSHECCHRARCPVVVVPHERAEAERAP